MFQKLSVQPAYNQVIEAIEHKILSGELSLGDQIGTEAELEEQFGLSRNSIREGVRVLEHMGLLSREKGRRLSVSQPESSFMSEHISRSLIMQRVTYRELVEHLCYVEMASIDSALQRGCEKLLEKLRQNLAETKANLDAPETLARLDMEFHTTLAHATNNSVMIMSYEPVGQLIYASTQQIFEKAAIAAPRLLEAHSILVSALENKDRDKAFHWMKKHILDFERGLEGAGVDFDAPVNPKYWPKYGPKYWSEK